MRKIEVHLEPDTDPDNQITPYYAVVLEWGNGPCWARDETGKEYIMPGTENGFWFNTGIVCWAETIEKAFSNALKIAKERGF